MGQAPQLLSTQMHLVLTKWANKLGPMYRVRLANKTLIVLTDPDLVLPLLGSGPSALPKAAFAMDGTLDVGHTIPNTYGIFSTHDFRSEFHRTSRKVLAPAFSMNQQRKITLPATSSAARAMCDAWAVSLAERGSLSLEVRDALQLTMLDTVLRSTFDLTLSKDQLIMFMESMNPSLEEVTLRTTNPLRQIVYDWLPFLPWSLRLKAIFVNSINLWHMVWEHVRARGPYPEDNHSVSAGLARGPYPDDDHSVSYPDDDHSVSAGLWRLWAQHGQEERHVVAHTSAFVLGGHETTASTVAWALYDIACNPDVQARIVDELRSEGLLSTAATPGRPLVWSDYSPGLPYLDIVLKESFRLHSVAASTSAIRETDKDVDIGGYHVPRGTGVWMPILSLHTAEHLWDEPLAFKPERWTEKEGEGGISAKAAAAFMPFGTGPRNCIAQNQAKVQTKVFLVELLRSFRFSVDPAMGGLEEVHKRQRVELTLGVEGGIHLELRHHEK
ncbi:hypothetical protein FOA52_005364 [Chlamydomonas sp. UWO 241]|nr:hypothetical protein FOA52_005364 [Chlamydomonas sp. UWO 241]